MQIPILSGIYASGADLRTSYPVNLIPVPKESGISAGFLRPADGIVASGTGPGIDRGGVNWNGVCYRVMGSKLVTVAIDGSTTVLADVGGPDDEMVTFDYSFDKLAIVSGGRLYYWDGSILKRVTDPDLRVVIDTVWIDGYFMTTDGDSLIVTELNDPTQVNPLKYGSSEVDPDKIVALLRLRNEAYALNRYTIEAFDNVGGDFFPFRRIDGAQIQKGVIGTFACCVFVDTIAFLGSGRNEPPAIYMAANATAQKISTQEIDQVLLGYTEAQLSGVKIEARFDKAHEHLYVHLPDRTIVFDAAASAALKQPVWFTLTSSLTEFSQYRARHFVWAYDKWMVSDTKSAAVGAFSDERSDHWGAIVRWEFGALIVYAESRGALFNQLELVAMPGGKALGIDARISTSYSVDGKSWSQDRSIRASVTGSLQKRLAWLQQGHMRNWRIQRFRGDSQSNMSFLRLDAQIEPLAY